MGGWEAEIEVEEMAWVVFLRVLVVEVRCLVVLGRLVGSLLAF